MNLHFKSHTGCKAEIYVAPLAQHENAKYADAFLKHFKPYSIGLTSKKELEEFKIVALLHGHNIIVED